jgi:two-component system OmpR family response regulator/two-component system alkaline phosphatase synthesis response regulator PhoP
VSAYILLVDDDADTADILRFFLEREGYEVVLAREGSEALRLLGERGEPDLMLLDLKMPGLDGWGVMEALARHPSWLGIPVVVLTSSWEVSVADVLALGADGMLLKPVMPDELLATVERYSSGF